MNECIGKNYILNGDLRPAESFSNSYVYEGDSIYEVLRIVKGSPVFFKDHMIRLSSSVKLQKKEILADVSAMRNAIINLTIADRKEEANIKIVFNYNNGINNFLVYYIEHIYPSEEQYKKGVKGILFSAERKSPESKIINHELRSSIYHRLILEGGYEALLVNSKNQITEGSRSNIFFLKGETLITAPDNVILNGITRKYILEICQEYGIKVELLRVRVEEISEYDAVFMTGTSPMVLPFYCIDDKKFDPKLPVISRLRQLYMLKAEESIKFFTSE